jgi:HK97 family phage major capsid protein
MNMPGAITELERRRDRAVELLHDAAARAADGDTAASVDLERHAEALRTYAGGIATLSAVDRRYADGKASFFADVLRSAKDRDADSWRRLKADSTDYRSTTGNFGALVVPQYLNERIRSSGHSLRPVCDYFAEPLGGDGVVVNVTRVSTGATAEDGQENVAVTFDDPASTEQALPVKVVVSGVNVTFQLANRSDPEAFDNMISREVLGAADALQESNVLNGAGGNAVTGFLNLAGVPSFTLTSTTPASVLDAVARQSQASHEATGRAPDTVIMSPRRWAWLLRGSGDFGAAIGATATADGPVVGRVLNLSAVVTPSMPLTLGTSTNEDRIIVCRRADIVMAESPATVQVITDAASMAPNLSSRIEVRRYYAFGAVTTAGVQVITGAGLSNPYV